MFVKKTNKFLYVIKGISQVVLVLKNVPSNAGDIRNMGLIPGSGSSPGGQHGTHSGILAWRIPWTEEPWGLQSMGLPRVGHDWVTKHIESTCARVQQTPNLSLLICGPIHTTVKILLFQDTVHAMDQSINQSLYHYHTILIAQRFMGYFNM